MSWPIHLDGSGRRAYRKLPPPARARVDAVLRELGYDPAAGRPLTGDWAGRRSRRCGSLRVIYRFADKTVQVLAIGPRRSVYRRPR